MIFVCIDSVLMFVLCDFKEWKNERPYICK